MNQQRCHYYIQKVQLLTTLTNRRIDKERIIARYVVQFKITTCQLCDFSEI